jgi:ankyrin repeat protein
LWFIRYTYGFFFFFFFFVYIFKILVTAMSVAALAGQWRCVRVLLSLGASPLARDTAGWNPLHRAVLGGCLRSMREIVEALVGGGGTGRASGDWAAAASSEAQVLASPLDVAVGARGGAAEGLSALHLACVRGRIDMVELLVANGASKHLPAPNGWAPIHFAAAVSADTFFGASDHGLDGASTSSGETPEQIAQRHGVTA